MQVCRSRQQRVSPHLRAHYLLDRRIRDQAARPASQSSVRYRITLHQTGSNGQVADRLPELVDLFFVAERPATVVRTVISLVAEQYHAGV